MSWWPRKQSRQVRVPINERWRQVFRAGEVALHPFTQAELDAVTLDRDALPLAERGPFLPPLTSGSGLAGAETGGSPTGEALTEAVANLERLGFVRPWPPAAPHGPIADELAGWSVAPEAGPGGRRRVALAGDLAIITSTRSQPVWVAEVSTSAEPAHPDPGSTVWELVARVSARYRPPVGLVERPIGSDGTIAPFLLVRDDRALLALVSWCGADLTALLDRERTSVGSSPAAGVPPPQAATADLAAGFRSLAQLCVAHASGGQVRLRRLVVATDGRGHWVLEGERWERAVGASVNDLGGRVAAILKVPEAEGKDR